MDELLLGVGRALEVQAANAAALHGPGVVDLCDRPGPAGFGELVGAEDAGQEAARIAEPAAAHAFQAGQRRVLDDEPPHPLRPGLGDVASATATGGGVAS